uniref:Uncharacterized protein n=1 Tax=Trichuris muris TaxID=70415 RepID=A0A5S6QXB6_TRIMR
MTDETVKLIQSECAPADSLVFGATNFEDVNGIADFFEPFKFVQHLDKQTAKELLEMCIDVALPRLELLCQKQVDTIRRLTWQCDQANRKKPSMVDVEQNEVAKEQATIQHATQDANMSNQESTANSETAISMHERDYSHNTSEANYSELDSIGIQAKEKPYKFPYDEIVCGIRFIGHFPSCQDQSCSQFSTGNRMPCSLQEQAELGTATDEIQSIDSHNNQTEDAPFKLTIEMHDKTVYLKSKKRAMKISLDT